MEGRVLPNQSSVDAGTDKRPMRASRNRDAETCSSGMGPQWAARFVRELRCVHRFSECVLNLRAHTHKHTPWAVAEPGAWATGGA